MSDIKNQIVKVSAIEQRGQDATKFKVVAENGNSFVFKRTKADGTQTQQYTQVFGTPPIQVGQIVKVGYEEKSFQGTAYNQLVSIYPYTPKPGEHVDFNSSPEVQQTAPAQNYQTTNRDDSIVRQVAFKGAIELVASGKLPLQQASILEWTGKLEQIIKGTFTPEVAELPVIDQETPAQSDLGGIRVEDIPFS